MRSRPSVEDWANYLVTVFALAAFAFFVLHSSPGPTLGDYVEWTYHGVLLRDVLQGHPDPGYWLKNYPVPNDLTTLGLGTLMLVIPWQAAAKLWLLLGTAFGLFAAHRLQAAASDQGQSWRLPVITAAVLLGSTLWFGFFNFMLGTYFAMWVCALLLSGAESRWKYALLLVLAFLSHMIPWFFATLALTFYAWQHRRYKLLLQSLPSWLLCLWYLAGRMAHGNADAKTNMVASVPYASSAFVVFKLNSYLKSWGFINPALAGTDSVLLQVVGLKLFLLCFFCDVAVALLALVLLWRMGFAALRQRSSRMYFWAAVALFCVVGLLMPGAAAGISDPGARMLQVALWCGVCVIVAGRRSMRTTFTACAAVLLLTNVWLMDRVMTKPPQPGALTGHIPAHVRQFAHVYYGTRWNYYDAIPAARHDLPIYPTAMFLRVTNEPAQKGTPTH